MKNLIRLLVVPLLLTFAVVVAPTAQASSTQLVAAAGSSWQTNGAVWALAYAGGRVYLGGEFTSVRPPGAAPGTGEVPRAHIAAFDAATGALVNEFDPGANDTVYALNASPDGRTLYAGGVFTQVKGQVRNRVAAFDISTAAGPLTTFRPSINGTVRAIASSASTVYVGGGFGSAGGKPRARAAAFGTDGTVTAWAPAVDDFVLALLVAPSQDRVIVGGAFNTVNGVHHRAIGSVDTTTGTTNMPMDDGIIPFCTGGCTTKSVVKSIVTDGTSVYVGAEGTGGGWFDGTLKLDPLSGHQIWKDNCLGATQVVAVINNVLYGGSHAHDCTAVAGGFPQDPNSKGWHHLTAEATTDGTVQPWFPNTNAGPSTTPNAPDELGPRAMATDGTQLFVGGHFTTVNDLPQQGFARFGTGPDTSAPAAPPRPAVTSNAAGTVTVHWTGTSGLDDGALVYRVYRGATLIYTSAASSSRFWLPSQFRIDDTGLKVGSRFAYTVEAVDGAGNVSARSPQVAVTVAGGPNGGYPAAVLAGGPQFAWRLDDSTATVADSSGNNRPGGYHGGGALGQPGVLTGSPSATLTDGFASSAAPIAASSAFSLELWFRTTTRTGGRLIGYGNSQAGTSSSYDRQVYMNDGGQLMFGTNGGGVHVAWSKNAYNDGTWHHVVATQGSAGMVLYVDGAAAATDPATTAQSFTGYWRVGNDNLNGWPRQPTSSAFEGSVDEAAVYGRALTAAEALAHYAASS